VTYVFGLQPKLTLKSHIRTFVHGFGLELESFSRKRSSYDPESEIDMKCAETGNAISDVYYQCEECKTTWGVIGFSNSSQTQGANCTCGGKIEYFNLKVPDTGPATFSLPNNRVSSRHSSASSKMNDNAWFALIAIGAFAVVTVGSLATGIYFANTKKNHLQWITVLISIGCGALWFPRNGEVFMGFSHDAGLSLAMLNLMGLIFAVIALIKNKQGKA
jgi:hypothetical protein